MNQAQEEDVEKRKYKMRASAFLLGVATISGIAGFAKTISVAKKKDTQFFNKGIAGSIEMADTGVVLGM
jgi:hypothetical protein